ncbi:hypothetical protein BDM02DRAFT_3107956, partial [Thelephora ganbajun]
MIALFRQRPGAVQKLTRWMKQWSEKRGKDVPASFQQVCKQSHEAARLDVPSSPSPNEGA